MELLRHARLYVVMQKAIYAVYMSGAQRESILGICVFTKLLRCYYYYFVVNFPTHAINNFKRANPFTI